MGLPVEVPRATRQSDWAPARHLAKLLGIVLIGRADPDQPRWSGRVLRVGYPLDALHDIAHFQVAPAWRRRVPGFGLGMEPSGNASAPYLVSLKADRSSHEEQLASLLGLAWGCALGYEWIHETQEHNWIVTKGDESPLETVSARKTGVRAKLEKLGLVRCGVPVYPPVTARSWRVSSSLRFGPDGTDTRY